MDIESVKIQASDTGSHAEHGPCLHRQGIEITSAPRIGADHRQHFRFEPLLLERSRRKADPVCKALYLLFVADGDPAGAGTNRRGLLPDQRKDAKSQQQMVNIFDQSPGLRVILEKYSLARDRQSSIAGE